MKDEFDKIEAEKRELNLLIGMGLTFMLDHTIKKRQAGILGYLKKRLTVAETLTFKIEEPTLATLDRLASEQVELRIDEKALSSGTGLSEAKNLTNQHAKRCAKIIALAVLGSDYMEATQHGARVEYIPNEKKLKELTELFFQNIKPSKLIDLVKMVNLMSNMGDFCNSIRSLSASRTTMPTEIED